MDNKYVNMAHKVLDSTNNGFIKENFSKLYSKDDEKKQLRNEAQETRKKVVGDKLFVRGSLEYSNYCSNSCAFCGMAGDNISLSRYELSFDEVKQAVNQLIKYDVHQLHIVTGENWEMKIQKMCDVVKYAVSRGLGVTLVLGELKEEEYEQLYSAGANRYILKFETSNPENYSICKSGKNLYERVANLFLLRDIGFKIGTGVISGLPRTTDKDLMQDLLVLKRIQPDMASVSIFSPNEKSRYADQIPGDIQKTLNFVSLMRRHLLKTKIITCSSSFGSGMQVEALNAGANLMSYHITPHQYAKEFSMYTYENRIMTQYTHIKSCAEKGNLSIVSYI